jgi:hypothetical protein
MPKIPQSLEGLSSTATIEDIDDCLRSLDIYRDKDLINFWLDVRIMVKKNNTKKKEAIAV